MRTALTAALAALVALAAPALGQDIWQSVDMNPGTYWVADHGGQRLQLMCNGAGGLMLLLLGGETRLPQAVESETEFQLVYRLAPSGVTRSAVADWLGPFDNALNGTFPSDPEFLDAFESAETMEILAPGMSPLSTLPMSGASWARFGFGEVCGL